MCQSGCNCRDSSFSSDAGVYCALEFEVVLLTNEILLSSTFNRPNILASENVFYN